jgi:phage replication O-like protein O
MSTPQLEDGFVRIANELLEAILGGGFSQRELLVLFTIMRKTYGFQKSEDDMSASQIGDMCKLARPHVTTTLNLLAQRNVITKRPGRFGAIVGIQKDRRKWVSCEQTKPVPASTESVHPCTDSVHVPNEYTGSTESVQADSTDSVHTKDNLQKDNYQKKTSCAPQADRDLGGETPAGQPGRAMTGTAAQIADRFERFYAAYPKKRSRGVAEKAFAKLKPSEELLAEMLAALAVRAASGTWVDLQYVPHPASWLNAKGWADVVEAEYSPVERDVIEKFNDALGDVTGVVSTTLFVPARAAAIRDFMTFSKKPGFLDRIFPWVRDNATIPPNAGFDWLISRKGYDTATGGQHNRK